MNFDSSTSTNLDTTLGRIVVDLGLTTDEEVAECRKQQKHLLEQNNPKSLAELLVEHGAVTIRQVRRAMQEAEASRTPQQIPNYQLLGKLGSGAMATVVKARQLNLDRIVAIKILPKKYMADPDFVDRFYAEGRAAAKLNHPNIVQAIDVGKAGDFHYFVMEYVEGYSVYEYLQKHEKYDEREALNIIIQIGEALAQVHSKGMMHRDVKPKNIMITKNGIPKLTDMGLARQVADMEAAQAEAGKAYGTPYYISPEQIRGKLDIDFRADIYGLGATFYHMVTGRVPFDGPNPSAVMHKHLTQPLTPPDHMNPELSDGVSEIIEVMMAKNPEDRYTSTEDMLEDLRSVANGGAPLQARKRFEIGKLSALEEGEDVRPTVDIVPAKPLLEQPLFWFLGMSVLVNLLLIAVLLAMSAK